MLLFTPSLPFSPPFFFSHFPPLSPQSFWKISSFLNLRLFSPLPFSFFYKEGCDFLRYNDHPFFFLPLFFFFPPPLSPFTQAHSHKKPAYTFSFCPAPSPPPFFSRFSFFPLVVVSLLFPFREPPFSPLSFFFFFFFFLTINLQRGNP